MKLVVTLRTKTQEKSHRYLFLKLYLVFWKGLIFIMGFEKKINTEESNASLLNTSS